MHQTMQLTRTNSEFRDALHQNVKDFWTRKLRKDGLTEQYRFPESARLSERYLIEETAIFSQMFKAARAVDVHPGSMLLPCVIFAGRHVPGAPEGLELCAFTRIDFARNKGHALKVA